MGLAVSESVKDYFRNLETHVERCYQVAAAARKKGVDPATEVEIPVAEDLASRVEKLLKFRGIADIIRQASARYNREEMSIIVAKRVAKEFKGARDEALDMAVRVGLAVLTEGILVAPLDGIAGVKVHQSRDSTYASISFAGPIRSAGGTGQAMSVLIADVVRRELGIGPYNATEEEVERWKEEVPLYRRLVNLQYLPSDSEIDAIIRGCKVCIDGEGTEDEEISGYRDLPRISTNRVRGGACLVVAEGLALKAKKLQKHVANLDIPGWEFLDDMVRGRSEGGKGIEPNFKFIKDMVAGRPVYSHPSTKGAFRLRYGRSRTAGLASISVNPAVMHVLGDTLAVGTQIKLERPGKAGITTPCDRLEGPLVLLKSGDLVRVNDAEQARNVGLDSIERIVDLGEILIPVGEFLENNHPLMPGVFDMGWYRAELDDLKINVEDPESMDLDTAVALARDRGAPLHPRYTFMWANLSRREILDLRKRILETASVRGGTLELPDTGENRASMMSLGIPYRLADGVMHLDEGLALLPSLGLAVHDGGSIGDDGTEPDAGATAPLELVRSLSRMRIMDRRGTYIGARMARPEKADMRTMKPPVHGLFPVGTAGGPQRLMAKAAGGNGHISVDLGVRICRRCGNRTYLPVCDCGAHTLPTKQVEVQSVDIRRLLDRAKSRLNISQMPKVKGVQGMISRAKVPEMPEKGILRAKHGVFVFKDGTIRFDCTDAPLTHFRPREIGTDVDRLRELGYTKDMDGNDLVSDEQLVELKVQDIVLPESGGDYLLKVSGFIDELLEKVYDMEPFYGACSREDLIGTEMIGLSPHTSGGVLCRLIGFTRANVGYAHPYFHAAKRRNCDGDEDCFMLLMDGLLNFSVSFLPEKRGGRMDAPLVLMTRIDPNEIDKEAHNIDVMSDYPLEVYRGGMEYLNPKQLLGKLDTVGSRIGSNLQYEGLRFTMDTADISAGPVTSTYKTLESMDEKTRMQLGLARLIDAVDERDVAERLLNNHFIPDMIGNLRSFSNQKLRCTKCGAKYRRMPLAGACKCGHPLTMTVHVTSVMKYLEMSKAIAMEYGVSEYVKQRIDQLENNMNSMFRSDKVRDCTLSDFL